MKRNAINLIGRILYASRIKSFEKKIETIYNEDWKNKSWEDYAIDIWKFESESKTLIHNSTGSKRINYLIGLQAYYNIREKELKYVEEKVSSLPMSEFKYFFVSEYEALLININEAGLNRAFELYSECGQIANSEEKRNYRWKHISACLIIQAIDEVFGDELNRIERNIRGL